MSFSIGIARLDENLRACVLSLAEDLQLSFDPPYTLWIEEGKEEYLFYDKAGQTSVKKDRRSFFTALRDAVIRGGTPRTNPPLFRSLGFMADCSRNAVLTVESVKKLVRKLALLGYTQLQLYMEDTYEVEQEPYFGYFRGRYTAKELGEIDKYCSAFGIEFVPAIQTLAHLGGIFRWRPYWKINDCQDILLADDEKTYEFIEHMLSSLRKCISGGRINIGMDEAHFLGLGKYLSMHGYTDRFEIMLRHLGKVIALCKKYGFAPMMWSDMFYRLTCSADYEAGRGDVSEEDKKKIPEGVSLVYWNYYERDGGVYDRMIASHMQFERPLVFAGGAIKWMGFAPDNRYSLDVSEKALKACRRNGVENVLLTAWGDNGAECSIFSVLPVMAYYAAFNEGAEGIGDPRFAAIFRTVAGMELQDFMGVDLINRLSDSNDPRERNGSCKYLLYNDPFLGTMDSTVREDMPQRYAAHGRTLKKIAARAGEWRYIFQTLARLCDLLEIKSVLGVKVREAFREGGRTAIQSIVSDFYAAERALRRFIEAFRVQWFSENKPNGFEVHEIRLGGLLFRLQSCRKRIERFLCDGTPISELEEELLDYFGNGKDFAKPCDCTDTAWHWLASVNNFL